MTTPIESVPLDHGHHWKTRLGDWTTTLVAGAVLVCSWLSVADSAWHLTNYSPDPWVVADWLINLQGGAVRRGFIGELLFSTGLDADGTQRLVIILQMALLAMLYGLVVALFRQTSRSWAWVMLVLSPAFLLFPLLSFGGGLRKELIVLVALALLGLSIARGWQPAWYALPLLLYGVAVTGHETAALLLPVAAFLIWISHRSGMIGRLSMWGWLAAFGAVSLTGLLWAAAHPGSPDAASAICESWTNRGAADEACTGSIAALNGSLIDAIRAVSLKFPGYFAYLPLALLALVPLAALRAPRALWWLGGATYLFLVPAFATGYDYGRWIYMATSGVSIAALTCARTDFVREREFRVPWGVAFLFVAMWSLPYTGPVLQEPLYGRVIEGPYHALAEYLGRVTGM